MTLDVSETETPGIFQAELGFGVVTGIMILGSQEAAVDATALNWTAKHDPMTATTIVMKTRRARRKTVSPPLLDRKGRRSADGAILPKRPRVLPSSR